MYTKILIPVAFDSEKDVSGAIEIAKLIAADDASITFLHVIPHVPLYAAEYIADDILAESRTAAQARLNEMVTGVDNAHAVVIDGPSGRSITNWADETGVDCIVMASHTPALSDILLGSTAAWVVRHAHCAVHVIR